MKTFEELVKQCEADIRAGQVAQAARRLSRINTAEVPRALILPIANVCRRAGLITLGLRLLSPIVRPQKKQHSPATAQERAEYSVLLHRYGANTESLRILNQLDTKIAPEAALYKVFCHFNNWDYESALTVLEDYLAGDVSPYMRIVGQLNQASALVNAGRYEEADAQVSSLIDLAKSSEYARLQANGLELRAQVAVHRRDFSSARADLNTASALLPDSQVFDSFLVRKWQAILTSLESSDLTSLLDLRKEAFERNEWESAREADRFSLAVSFSERTYRHLMFGTPYPKYRDLLARELSKQVEDGEYVWGESGCELLDLASGRLLNGRKKAAEIPQRKCHQVLEILARDFYRGIRIGGLFSEIFTGEYFDIFSSPGRVRQLLHRTRAWAQESSISLGIEEKSGFYRLALGPDFGIRVTLQRKPLESYSGSWELLKQAFQSQGRFSAAEARRKVDIPRTTLQRVLKWAIEQRLIDKTGPSNAVVYVLKNADASFSKVL